MNDLLHSVKGGESQNGRPVSSLYDVEAGYTANQEEKSKDMDQFFAKVDELKQDMVEIKAKQRELLQMHERSKSIVRPKEMQQHQCDMQVRPTAMRSFQHCYSVCCHVPPSQCW
jgi:hypothetical protein